MRTVPTYRKDIGPRLGFAYQIDSSTVVRGGAGVYFGMSPATNFQYPGSAFRKTANMFFTNDNFATQSATLENPFPAALPVRRARSTARLRTGAIQTRTIWARRRRGTPTFTSGIWESSGAAQPDRARRGLLRQPQHPSALVWHQQPGFHSVVSLLAQISAAA
jgi:hypothetical protein